MEGTAKVMLPILLYWPTSSEADVDSLAAHACMLKSGSLLVLIFMSGSLVSSGSDYLEKKEEFYG